ncbi:MAG: hypothetical protein ACREOO_29025 [bacterium]
MASSRARGGVAIRAVLTSKPVAAKTSHTSRPALHPGAPTIRPRVKIAKIAGPVPFERLKRKSAFFLLVPFAVLLILSLLLIGLRVSVGQLAKKISELEAQATQLQDENNRYLVRAEQLAGYIRISRLAHERLGLVGLAPKLIVVSSE